MTLMVPRKSVLNENSAEKYSLFLMLYVLEGR